LTRRKTVQINTLLETARLTVTERRQIKAAAATFRAVSRNPEIFGKDLATAALAASDAATKLTEEKDWADGQDAKSD
jgi:hypothetical protein